MIFGVPSGYHLWYHEIHEIDSYFANIRIGTQKFFSKSMMSNVFKTLSQSIIPLFSQFLRLYGK
eukprot:UN24451